MRYGHFEYGSGYQSQVRGVGELGEARGTGVSCLREGWCRKEASREDEPWPSRCSGWTRWEAEGGNCSGDERGFLGAVFWRRICAEGSVKGEYGRRTWGGVEGGLEGDVEGGGMKTWKDGCEEVL